MNVISIIEKKLGKKAKIEFKPMQLGDVKETHADIEKAKSKLDFNPKINLEEGISSFLKWYEQYST